MKSKILLALGITLVVVWAMYILADRVTPCDNETDPNGAVLFCG